jgi:Glycosyltransferase family 9 (heptosyltransferase)
VNIVAVAPVSDEPRRSMDPGTLRALIAALARWHPGCEIRVLVNPADRDAQPLLEAGKNAGLPAGTQFELFPTLQALVEALCRLEHLYSTDTGLYHLAAAIGVPTTAYFGPTQPWKNGFPAQPALTRVRLAALGGDHCEEKQCRQPVCLANAVALHASAPAESSVDGTPPHCLLRRHTGTELGQVAVQEAIPVN